MEEIKEKEFIKACYDDYKEVEFLMGFVNDETSIPHDEEDKLIYNINKILFTPNPNPENNNQRLDKIIELIKDVNVRQIARNIFVLLHYHDLMENNGKPSWGEHLLRDLIKEDKIVKENKEIFKREYEYIYNKSFDTEAISPEQIELVMESVPEQTDRVSKPMGRRVPISMGRRVHISMRSFPPPEPQRGAGKLYKNNRNNNKK